MCLLELAAVVFVWMGKSSAGNQETGRFWDHEVRAGRL